MLVHFVGSPEKDPFGGLYCTTPKATRNIDIFMNTFIIGFPQWYYQLSIYECILVRTSTFHSMRYMEADGVKTPSAQVQVPQFRNMRACRIHGELFNHYLPRKRSASMFSQNFESHHSTRRLLFPSNLRTADTSNFFKRERKKEGRIWKERRA